MILTILLTSCKTLKVEKPAPDFPSPYKDGILIVAFDEQTETVSMPLWYWKKIVEYAVDVQGVKSE